VCTLANVILVDAVLTEVSTMCRCGLCPAVDWIVVDMLAVRQGSLGHIRYILKDGLKYLPLFGSYFRQVLSGIHTKGSVKEPNMFHSYATEKITHKASDAAEKLQL